MEERLLPPSLPAVQTVMAQERYVLPTRKAAGSQEGGVVWSLQAALHQPACRLSAHPTSLLQKSRKKKRQSLQAIGLRSKEKAET